MSRGHLCQELAPFRGGESGITALYLRILEVMTCWSGVSGVDGGEEVGCTS